MIEPIVNSISEQNADKSTPEFGHLEVFESVPDQKYSYVLCHFYNRHKEVKAYIRSDKIICPYQIFQIESNVAAIDKIVCAVKEIQKHPVSGTKLHIDFYLVEDQKIRIKMPVKYINQDRSHAIKLGGYLNILVRNLEVKTSRDMLRPYLEVDVSTLKADQSIRLKDIQLPAGIESIRTNLTLATLIPSKGTDS